MESEFETLDEDIEEIFVELDSWEETPRADSSQENNLLTIDSF